MVNSNIIRFDNYNITRKEGNSRGGGVANLIRNDLDFERVGTLDKFGMELITIKVKLKNIFINVILIYIPPRITNQNKFLDQAFFNALSTLEPFILCGDLNCHSWNLSPGTVLTITTLVQFLRNSF